jgi:predicted dinucleotide-binding enzyme
LGFWARAAWPRRSCRRGSRWATRCRRGAARQAPSRLNNPVETEHFQLVDDFTPSLAEHLARVTGADAVKALNQVHRDVWSRRATYGGRPLVVPVATDSAAAREVADRLVLDAGATPFDAGPLAQARNIEAMTAVIIRHLHTGGDALSAFQLTVAEATSEAD